MQPSHEELHRTGEDDRGWTWKSTVISAVIGMGISLAGIYFLL